MKAKTCGPKVKTKSPTSTYAQDTKDMMGKGPKPKPMHRNAGRKR